jgi:Mn2+/Fe2+ NRAMP family transporter
MSDKWFVSLFGVTLLFFAAVGGVLLVWPSAFLRYVRNPLQPDTPLNRVYMRTLGVFMCLFVLLAVSGAFEGFQRNVLMALSISPVMLPILLWVLWRYTALRQVNRRYLVDGTVDPHWELRMSVAFCSLLFIIVASALLLAKRGIYLK